MQQPESRNERNQREGEQKSHQRQCTSKLKTQLVFFMQLFQEEKVVNHRSCLLPSTQACLEHLQYHAEPFPALGTQQERKEDESALRSTQEESLKRLSLRPVHF